MPQKQIRTIGMALSGGGYRAAGFHLGALDMLGRLNLLDRVKGISTVSGGTITGAYYALAQSRTPEKPASEVFATLARWLLENDVIGRVLSERSRSHRTSPGRCRNLITGASDIYDRLLGGALFGELFDRSGHLDDVIFNTTEFQTGLDFRFQKVAGHGAPVGNGTINITREAARQIRLGDIVAASSCFPGGFEPLEFPHDFVFRGKAPEMRGIPPGFAIMDGGIYDNQGTEALLLERADREAYDVIIVSDTDQRPRSAFYAVPDRRRDSRGIGIGTLVTLIFSLGTLTMVSAVLSVLSWLRRETSWLEIAIGLLPTAVAATLLVTLFMAWRAVKGTIAQSFPNLARGLRQYLFSLRWADLMELVSLRMGTLLSLTSQVFLKRVRQLGYDRLDEVEEVKDKTIASLIYAMATRKAAELPPTPAQKALAERANQMPTTLWFDGEQQFRDVFACGQNTVVHVLLRWFGGAKGEALQGDSDTAQVVGRLREAWAQLQEDPFRFVPDLRAGSDEKKVAHLPSSAGASGVGVAAARSRETA